MLDVFQFVGIGRRNRIPNNRGVFKLRANGKYNTYIHPQDEVFFFFLKGKAILAIG
jgi:hypothetical protein